MTVTLFNPPEHGTVSGTGAALVYTPSANYSGTDCFTFKVNDGTADSNVATVSITVTEANDAPVAAADVRTVLSVFITVMLGSALLAWRNVKLGRGDRKGSKGVVAEDVDAESIAIAVEAHNRAARKRWRHRNQTMQKKR